MTYKDRIIDCERDVDCPTFLCLGDDNDNNNNNNNDNSTQNNKNKKKNKKNKKKNKNDDDNINNNHNREPSSSYFHDDDDHDDDEGNNNNNNDIKIKKNWLYSLLWFFLAIYFAYPLAFFLCGFWLLSMMFEPFVPPLVEANNFIAKFVYWPRQLGKAIHTGQEDFPNPLDNNPKEEQEATSSSSSPQMIESSSYVPTN